MAIDPKLDKLTASIDKLDKTLDKIYKAAGTGGQDPRVSKEELSVVEEVSKKIKEIEEARKRQAEKEEYLTKLLQDQSKLSQTEIEYAKEELKVLQKQREELEKQNSTLGKLQRKYNEVKKVGGAVKDVLGQMVSAMEAVANSAAVMAEKFGGLEQNLLNFDTAKDQAKNINQLATELKRTSGISEDLSSTIYDTQAELRSFGITSEKTAQTIQTLGSSMSDFTRMDKNTREELTKTVAKFTTLGVSVEDTTNLLETGTKTLGMSSDQALLLQEELVKTARGIGVAPSQMVQGFAQAAPRLAAHGASINKVFEGLALQSKNTGVSIEGLLGITEGFDTFEQAARKTSQLNAMFGTQLNSVDLLNASEEERIKILQDSLAATGKSIDTMGRFELKSLAQIIGVDVATVRKTFGATTEGLDDLEKKASAAKTSVNIEEEMEKGASATEAMKAANEAFKNTLAREVQPAIEEQAKALSTNDNLMKSMRDRAKQFGQVFSGMIEAATLPQVQEQFANIASAQSAIDMKNTMVAPMNSLIMAGSSAISIFTNMGKVAGFFGQKTSQIASSIAQGGVQTTTNAQGITGESTRGSRFMNFVKTSRIGKFASNVASKFPTTTKALKFIAPKLLKFLGPITEMIMAGFNIKGILNKKGLSDKDKSRQIVPVIAGSLGSLIVGSLGALAGGPVGGILGAMGGSALGKFIGGSKMAQDIFAPVVEAALNSVGLLGGEEVAATAINPSTIETPPPSRPALVPPRVTPQADTTNAQTQATTSAINTAMSGMKQGMNISPNISLTAYVGGRKTETQLFVNGAKGIGVGSVSTNSIP